MRRHNSRRRRSRFRETEDINPMNFVSNLSDVMLILAVGIMLALILHWKVEIKEPVRQLGDYELTVHLYPNVSTRMLLRVKNIAEG